MNEMLHFISKSPLPVVYREACDALARCERADECKDWSDRAMALASYARQAKDQTLLTMAQRIQLRAVARIGELLSEIEPAKPGPQLDGGGPTQFGRFAAGSEAGLSRDQTVTALRVANVPATERDALIESDAPPTVTELARIGTKRRQREPDPHGPAWADWVFSIKRLRSLPACGLDVLAERRELPASRLIADAEAALENLELWIKTLERIDAIKAQ